MTPIYCLVDLQHAIRTFTDKHNQPSKPFVWKATPKAIIAAAARRRHQALETIHQEPHSNA